MKVSEIKVNEFTNHSNYEMKFGDNCVTVSIHNDGEILFIESNDTLFHYYADNKWSILDKRTNKSEMHTCKCTHVGVIHIHPFFSTFEKDIQSAVGIANAIFNSGK